MTPGYTTSQVASGVCYRCLVDHPEHISLYHIYIYQIYSKLENFLHEDVCGNCSVKLLLCRLQCVKQTWNCREATESTHSYIYIRTYICMWPFVFTCIYVRTDMPDTCMLHKALTRWFLWVITLRFASYFCLVLYYTTVQCLISISLQDEHGFHGLLTLIRFMHWYYQKLTNEQIVIPL